MSNAWWKLENGPYINPDHAFSLYPQADGVDWKIQVVTLGDPTEGFNLEGTYPDKATAEAAIKNLVNGVTVADLVS